MCIRDRRYPYDATLSDFHTKLARASKEVNTPFVLPHDNDDFFITETIQKCVDFLIKNPEYNSARGKNFDFYLSHGDYGQVQVTHEMWTKFPNSIIGETVRDRLLDQASHFHANSHNVRRTKNLQATYELIEIVDFANYRFAHQAESFLNVIWGKSNREISGIHLLHQGSSPSIGSGHFPPQKEWIMAEYWKNDFIGMMDLCGAAIHYYDGISLEKSRNMFADAYINKLPDLKELLTSRIKECKKEKINENRIKNMLKCINTYTEQKDLPTEEQAETVLSAHDEINAIRNFLMRGLG